MLAFQDDIFFSIISFNNINLYTNFILDGPLNAWDKPIPANSPNSVAPPSVVSQPGTSLQLAKVLGPNSSAPTEPWYSIHCIFIFFNIYELKIILV